MRIGILAAAGLVLSTVTGCASIVEGTNQTIMVNMVPETSQCVATRQGSQVGVVSGSARQLPVSKSRHDLWLRCTADGYETSDIKVESSASGWGVAGGIAFDLGITDYMTGALNKYPETVTVALVKKEVK
ncbi:MAG: hypothetical protein VW600_07360 [Ferrovibrio sp.]